MQEREILLDTDTDIIKRDDGTFLLRQYQHESPFKTRDSKQTTHDKELLISLYRSNYITWQGWE